MLLTRSRALLVAGAFLLLASGCSSGSSNEEQVGQRLQTAKADFDAAKYVGFTLHGDNLPDGVDTLVSASGTGTHAPAFTGQVEVHRGISFTAPIVAVNGKVYAKLPFVSWTTIDPADYGAPDPSRLMADSHGLSALLTETTGAHEMGSERSGATVLTKIVGTLPGADVHQLFPSAGTGRFSVTYRLTDADVLHDVSMTGPFYGDHGTSTYSIELDLSADPVAIKPPE